MWQGNNIPKNKNASLNQLERKNNPVIHKKHKQFTQAALIRPFVYGLWVSYHAEEEFSHYKVLNFSNERHAN